MHNVISRLPHGRGFRYVDDSNNTIKNSKLRQWIDSLAIPPAWKEVTISTNTSSKILVTGRDSKKRKQYIYNPRHVESSQQDKFDRILRFGKQLPSMRRKTAKKLHHPKLDKEKILAGMTRMLDEAYFRPGNQYYTYANGTFGLTTLRSKHLTFENNRAVFNYIGKSGQEQVRKIKNTELTKLLKTLDRMPGHDLFSFIDENGDKSKITADDLNAYIASTMGEDFSAKDFRTWAGTYIMSTTLNEFEPPDDDQSAKSNITEAYKTVANALGNTPAVTKESYVHPRVVSAYKNGITLEKFYNSKKRITTSYLYKNEAALICLLESQPFEDKVLQ